MILQPVVRPEPARTIGGARRSHAPGRRMNGYKNER